MGKGAVHPNGTNFRRVCKLDIVSQMRKLVEQDVYDRPIWLNWVERVPPLELHNLKIVDKKVYNPYAKLLKFLLKKYPDLRFHDAFVLGNDWTKGNDRYRDDHPAMQFVTQQLRYMNQGHDIKMAFKMTEEKFYKRRMKIERDLKINMCLSQISDVSEVVSEESKKIDSKIEVVNNSRQVRPFFSTGAAYVFNEMADAEAAHLEKTRNILRGLRAKHSEEAISNDEKERRRAEKYKELKATFCKDVAIDEKGNNMDDPTKNASFDIMETHDVEDLGDVEESDGFDIEDEVEEF